MAEIKKRKTRMYEPWGYQEENNYESSETQFEIELNELFASAAYNDNDKKIHFFNNDGLELSGSSIDTTLFAPGVIREAYYDSTTKELVIVFENGTEVRINMREIIDETEFGDGLQVSSGGIVSVKIDDTSDTYLTVGPDGIKLSGIDALIEAERERAISAETALQEAIEIVSGETLSAITELEEKVDEEITRAISAETELNEKIEDEKDRAISAETALGQRIDAEKAARLYADNQLRTALDNEIARATSAETALSGAITDERDRAISAETALSGAITDERDRAISAETALSGAITDERDRAISAETSLNDKIDQEIARATSAETVLDNKINAEEARAKAAESALTTALNAEIARSMREDEIHDDELRALDSRLDLTNAKLDAEITRSINADTVLDNKIEAEKQRAISAETVLDNKIEDEKQRAISAETELDENIEDLRKRIGHLKSNTTLEVQNENEASFGTYNDSQSDTTFSIGIGTSDGNRKNAIEAKNDGKVYMWIENDYMDVTDLLAQIAHETYDDDDPPFVFVNGVTLDKSSITVTVGNTDTLTPTVTPSNASDPSVVWESSDERVAKVDENGVVTAIAAGDATITVTTVDGGFTAQCAVMVPVNVTGVILDKNSVTLGVNETSTLTATVLPSDATDKSVTWSTSDASIATVDANGVVTAIAAGDVTITVTTVDGGFTAQCAVTVIVHVTGVTLNKSELSIKQGQSETLIATVLPSDATDKSVTWSSSDETIATVDANGVVTAIAAGDVTITVTTVDGGFTAQCAVTVPVNVTGVTLDKNSVTLGVNETSTLVATVLPADATDKSVTWSTSDASIATVDANGVVTAIAAGDVTITVTTVDGGYTAQCAVTVIVHVTGVILDKNSVALDVNETSTLVATVLPTDAADKSVTWSTSDSSIATVDANGLVTAVAVGDATITVTTVDGGFTAQCAVTVLVHVTGVILDNNSITLDVNETSTLVATVSPADATDKSVTWSSSNPEIATVNTNANANGIVSGVSSGDAIITVTTVDGGYTAQCNVTVESHEPVGNKIVLTLIDSVVEIECDGTSAITSSEISEYKSRIVSAEIGDCVTTINNYAFETSSNLKSISISDSVTSIGNGAFSECTSLTSVTIPNSVTTIVDSAFLYCTSLTSLTIGTGINNIARRAFNDCSSLASITVNATTPPTLGEDAFANTNNCPIYVPCESIDTYKTTGNWSNYADRIQCLPQPTTAITYNASSKLNVRLSRFTPAATAETYDSTTHVGKIEFSNDVTSIGIMAFQDCRSLTNIRMPDSVTSIGKDAFYICTGLTSIDIPDSVTSIGETAFWGCTSLTSCTIGSGITDISNGVFYRCSGLTSITIPDSVTNIGDGAFENCSRLQSIDIPSDVTSIGYETFMGCTSLTSITVNATTPPELDEDAFYDTNNCPIYVPCESVNDYKSAWSDYASRIQCPPAPTTAITYAAPSKLNVVLTRFTPAATAETFADGVGTIGFSNDVTSIGNMAFKDYSSLKYVRISDSVTSIGNSAFYGCSGLTSIYMPSGVTSIGDSAFSRCSGITSIDIPSGVTSIGSNAFQNCSSLTSVTIPSGVTSINNGTFESCSSIQSIDIPSGVTSIGYIAFGWCYGLRSITVNATTPPTLGNDVFFNLSNFTIYVPSGSVNAYKTASGWSAYASKIQAKP